MSTTQGMNSSSYTCDAVEGSAQHQIDLVSAELHKNKKTNEGEAAKCVANKWRRPWLQFGASNFASPVQKRGSQFHLLAARLEDDEDRVKMEALQTPSHRHCEINIQSAKVVRIRRLESSGICSRFLGNSGIAPPFAKWSEGMPSDRHLPQF